MRLLRGRIFPLLGVGVLLAFGSPAAWSGSPTRTQASAANLARSLLDSGRLAQAEQVIRAEIEMKQNDASLFCILGDILFRSGDFEGSAREYARARNLNPAAARAYWGLSRIAQIQFRRELARDLMAEAFRLDPHDSGIAVSYSDLGRDRAPRLSSPYTRYSLKLAPLTVNRAAPGGLLITAVINGGKALRLLLDTGAKGIVIDGKAARGLELDAITLSAIGGVGGAGLSNGHKGMARSVSFGALEFKDCVVEVSEKRLMEGVDGVVGLTMFDAFDIRVVPQARLLELKPLPEEAGEAGGTGSTRFYPIRHLILVKAAVDNFKQGLFLVDTGSAVTSISSEIFAPVAAAQMIPIQGPCGSNMEGRRLQPVTFELAGRSFVEREPVALDLSVISKQEGVRISGILGYPLLRNSTIAINYRDGVLKLDDAR